MKQWTSNWAFTLSYCVFITPILVVMVAVVFNLF